MYTISDSCSAKVEVKGSKFLSYLVKMEVFETIHETLKDEHPKASHIVYAYRFPNEFGQIVENSSDDGEPKGAASTPMLNVLRGENLVDIGLLIVRYFGGTKLGIGGMIRAYGLAAKEAIAAADIRKYELLEELSFSTPYAIVQRVEYLVQKIGMSIIKREFANNIVEWSVGANMEKLVEFKDMLGRDAKWSV